ncbi:hypothetical protein [Bacillus thuringiensis]|uniref:hypothetical protein n=1 Tax=Bacillus thuringiensis TaxID=1428 RepID=UPI001EE91006|nr:hypothetical protein [Bacillus thuringiensis]
MKKIRTGKVSIIVGIDDCLKSWEGIFFVLNAVPINNVKIISLICPQTQSMFLISVEKI